MSYFADYRDHAGATAERFFKATLFRSGRLLLGLNCLEPGQAQAVHDHADQDKFYFVLEGEGAFTVGAEARTAGPGVAVWARPGSSTAWPTGARAASSCWSGSRPAPDGDGRCCTGRIRTGCS